MSDGVLGLIGVCISVIGTIWISRSNQRNTEKQNEENKETQRIIQSSQKDFEVQMSVRQQEFQEKLTQKQINADVILKSRLHWIDDTKSIASEFLVDALKIVTLNELLVNKFIALNTLKKTEQKNTSKIKSDDTNSEGKNTAIDFDKKLKEIIKDQIESISKISIEINDLIHRTSKGYTLLSLNFSDNDENKGIIDSIKEINNDLRRVTREVKEVETSIVYGDVDGIGISNRINTEKTSINEKVDNLTITLRDYYKNEWERVKAGE